VIQMLIPPNSTIKLIAIEYHFTDDPYTQPDYLGKISQTWEKNAIRIKDNRWFVSENNKWSNWKEIWKDSYESITDQMIERYGSLKSTIYHFALDDLKRFNDFYDDKWNYVFLDMVATLEISINGITLTAKMSDSLGGIESDSSIDDYVSDMYSGLVAQLKTILPMSQIKEVGIVKLE